MLRKAWKLILCARGGCVYRSAAGSPLPRRIGADMPGRIAGADWGGMKWIGLTMAKWLRRRCLRKAGESSLPAVLRRRSGAKSVETNPRRHFGVVCSLLRRGGCVCRSAAGSRLRWKPADGEGCWWKWEFHTSRRVHSHLQAVWMGFRVYPSTGSVNSHFRKCEFTLQEV